LILATITAIGINKIAPGVRKATIIILPNVSRPLYLRIVKEYAAIRLNKIAIIVALKQIIMVFRKLVRKNSFANASL
jgi:hypothetical protein